jgi:hypothetical protein
MPEPYDVHTCHADCPCQHGGEPLEDFSPAEGSLLPGLLARARRQPDKAPTDRKDAGEPSRKGAS